MSKNQTEQQTADAVLDPENEDTRELLDQEPETALTTRTAGTLVPGQVDGDLQASDIRMPVMKLLQKMSDNPQRLPVGTFTANGDVILQNEKGEVYATVVSISKRYKEVLPFGAGIPRSFASLEEAASQGFSLARSKADRTSGRPVVEDSATAVLLVEQPEGSTPRSYPFAIGGINMLPVIWYLDSFAYSTVAKTIFTKRAFELKTCGLLPVRWKIWAESRTNDYGQFFVPHIQLCAEDRNPEFVKDLEDQVGDSFATLLQG